MGCVQSGGEGLPKGKAWARSEQGQRDLQTPGAEEASLGLGCGLQAPSRILGEATGREAWAGWAWGLAKDPIAEKLAAGTP